MNKRIKVLTVIGTRPEIIRLSSVLKSLDKYTEHIIVHTGQNYDYELNEIFFKDLGLRKPDYFLNVDTTSLGKVIGNIFIGIEEVLLKEKPDAFLVLGDTNSCLAAYMAKRMKITIYHMEAGNRCFDFNVPEETNRRVIDHLSDFNLVYTEHARRHLLAEGLSHRKVYLTGSPMYEVLSDNKKGIELSNVLEEFKLERKKYFVVSVHREENVDFKENLIEVVDILNSLVEKYNYPIIFSTHPRTLKRLQEIENKPLSDKILLHKPFGFFDYLKLQIEAFCTVSDSGTISEESSILNFPAITLRNSMERPEALDTGSIIITGLDKRNVLNSIDYLSKINYDEYKVTVPEDYLISNTSERVVKLILGTNRIKKYWDNIKI